MADQNDSCHICVPVKEDLLISGFIEDVAFLHDLGITLEDIVSVSAACVIESASSGRSVVECFDDRSFSEMFDESDSDSPGYNPGVFTGQAGITAAPGEVDTKLRCAVDHVGEHFRPYLERVPSPPDSMVDVKCQLTGTRVLMQVRHVPDESNKNMSYQSFAESVRAAHPDEQASSVGIVNSVIDGIVGRPT